MKNMLHMLRIVFALLFVVMIFLCVEAAAYAEGNVTASGTCGTQGDNLSWTLYDTGELVIEGTGWMQNYPYYKGYRWMDCPWYEYQHLITAVTIRAGVRNISKSAFENCSSLTSITIPDSVTRIGYHAFYNCNSLTSVMIPDSVEKIGQAAFRGCSSLTSITIPGSVSSIGDYLFSGCSGLTSITIQDGVRIISDSMFKNCSSLTNIIIPESVTEIGATAFRGCSSLTSITIPDSVTSIGWDTFRGCSSLTNITIPEGVTSIGSSAFYNCISLMSVTIPQSVTSIGVYAFENCSSLTGSIVIPDGVTSIGKRTFYNCSSLNSVTIPDSVTSIGGFAFYNCSSLTSVTIPESVEKIGQSAFRGCSSLPSVAIPAGVTGIGKSIFRDCSGLTSVTIPEGVKFISDSMFKNCSSLPSITIPESVTGIGAAAFAGCSSLTSITLPSRITSIGYAVSSGCSGLKNVTIPTGVTSIGVAAFYDCGSLADVYFGGSHAQWTAIAIGDRNEPLQDAEFHFGVFSETNTVSYNANGGKGAPNPQIKGRETTLTLSKVEPTHSKTVLTSYSVKLNTNDGYETMTVLRAARTKTYTFRTWNTAADGSGTDYAPGADYALDEDLELYAQWDSTTTVAAVTLPELAREGAMFLGWSTDKNAESGVMDEYTPTGNVTLYALWRTADFNLPVTVTAIEMETFAGGAFTYVHIPAGVESIGANAFAGCPNLRFVEIHNVNTVIDDEAFAGVTGLTIIAPEGSAAETWAKAHNINFQPAA